MDFATRFHLLRTEKGLSQREIAKALDSKHTTVASWEQGVSRPASFWRVCLCPRRHDDDCRQRTKFIFSDFLGHKKRPRISPGPKI